MNPDRRTILRTIGAGSIGTAAGLFGGSAAAATVITMKGGGEDIWSTQDAFHYYYAEVSGDFDVAVQNPFIEDIESFTKCGPMVRASLDADAANAMVRRRPNGEASMQYRPEAGAETSSVGGTPADWMRLRRAGDTVETYHSTDGSDWTLIERLGPDDIALGDQVYLGLSVTSHVVGELCTATFQNLSGVEPDTNRDIGEVEVAGSVSTQAGVPLVSTNEVTDVGETSATLAGELTDLGGADAADCRFEYREVPTESWTETEATARSSAGEFSATVDDLTGRRYYEVRAVAETSDGDTATGATAVFSTAAPTDGGGPPDDAGPETSSQFGPGDGFADAAPWLDDTTPVIKIREPTRRQLGKAVSVDGERLVVFETSGTIDLEVRDLAVPYDKLYLAGQTAPSPGITLIKGRLNVAADDCVIQHVRVRLGDAGYDEPTESWALDAVNTADETRNNVIDHVSASWSVDEVLSVGYDTSDTTVSNCLIVEALHDSVHPKGSHGYGSLIGNNAENVALLGNVWSQNTDRHPRLKEGTESAVVGNVVFNYEDGTWLDPDTDASIEGNAYLGPRTDEANVFAEDGVTTAVAHLADNYTDGDVPMVDDDVSVVDERPLWPEGLEPLASERTVEHDLQNAGARPADRTYHDRRVVEDVREGVENYIDSQEEVGGYPSLDENTRSLTVPAGGTRAWLESHAARVERPQVEYYQVDFVAGEPIEELGEDGLYADEDRLMRFARGTPGEGLVDKDTAWPSAELRDCLDYGHIYAPESGTGTVDFTVADDCEEVTLSLAVHSAPTAEFSMDTVDQQELLYATTETYGPGDHSIAVELPTDD
ncbi:pectate lyase [Candidatus Halobonum tyrrellensis G22]|uniref:Pectate lyase n=1 Tax=Candidatus Halobonum tyrrellensis G22 TaxID=1324957 RepID=V4HK68_9EURY|nr:pectate lyase [Candidatus Halobonum tyrrellensis]ESP90183.1 pectate lyase [Candidatus Halobonum tyrrellensis G22]